MPALHSSSRWSTAPDWRAKRRIAQAFCDCVDTCGARLLHIPTRKLSPQGASGVAVLRLRVFEDATFGRVLTLDGVVQTTQGDNFIYYEMMTCVLAHGAARVCISLAATAGWRARC